MEDPHKTENAQARLAQQAEPEFGVRLSAEALQQALNMQRENVVWQGLALRLYLEGKGCDGFYYGVSFDEATAQDLRFPQGEGGLELAVDKESMEFVRGSQIDWIDDERGRGFLVSNPKHRQFRGKFFKRKEWQNKLLQRMEGQDA